MAMTGPQLRGARCLKYSTQRQTQKLAKLQRKYPCKVPCPPQHPQRTCCMAAGRRRRQLAAGSRHRCARCRQVGAPVRNGKAVVHGLLQLIKKVGSAFNVRDVPSPTCGVPKRVLSTTSRRYRLPAMQQQMQAASRREPSHSCTSLPTTTPSWLQLQNNNSRTWGPWPSGRSRDRSSMRHTYLQ